MDESPLPLPQGPLLTAEDELLFRQVHPDMTQNGRPTSAAFKPSKKDQGPMPPSLRWWTCKRSSTGTPGTTSGSVGRVDASTPVTIGSPLPNNMDGYSAHNVSQPAGARFWERVDRSGGPSACWPWLLSCGSHGYGSVWDGTMNTCAHRVAFVLAIGPLSPGMTVDHNREVCSGGKCCNPAHLRERSHKDNATDNGQGLKTHCPQGHEYSEENTYRHVRGDRESRTYARERRAAVA